MSNGSQAARPNFFLIGAAKSGTTSVAKYLDEHPEIYVSKPKEPNYFAFEPGSRPSCRGPADPEILFEQLLKYTVTAPKEYASLFADCHGETAIGEASVRYLYEREVPTRIADYAPNAKLIVLLRDPIERLHSHYHMNARLHLEPEPLVGALAAEDQRVEQGWGWDWHYRRVGLYAEQLKRWFQIFDREQVLVLFHADLKNKPQVTLQSIFRHLEVTTNFQPDFTQRAMVGNTPRWRGLRRMIRDENVVKTVAKRVVPKRLRKSFVRWSETKNRMSIPPLSSEIRNQLRADYREADQRLADLLGCQLPW